MHGFILAVVSACVALSVAAAEPETPQKIPVIHSTDLLHPHDDPDDHFDLACLFALREFDIRGIILDNGRGEMYQVERSGRPAVEQMEQIAGVKTPCVASLNKLLRSCNDKALEQDKQFQGGVEMILAALRDSPEPVVLHAAGSVRDIAAAYNREPDLMRRKARAIYIQIGRGPTGQQREWNVALDPPAYLRLLTADLPLYWCPCFGTEGYGTHFVADQGELLKACSPAVQNFFVYCLTQSNADPIAFLSTGPHKLPGGQRNMWCTGPMVHAAGRKIYQRGEDDFVALSPEAACRAGLADKAVEVFRFVPFRATVERLPDESAKDKDARWPVVQTELNPDGKSNGFIFQVVDKRYSKIMASVLKNLLIELGNGS